MSVRILPVSTRWSMPQGWLVRMASVLLVIACIGASWIFIAQQQALLWMRLGTGTAERFVADQIKAPLPRLSGATELQAACALPLSWRTQWSRSWLRAELAGCLSNPDGWTSGAQAQAAIAHYETLLASQAQAAQAWLAELDAQSSGQRERLQTELTRLQTRPAAGLMPLVQMFAGLLPQTPTSVRENPDASATPQRATRYLREQLQSSNTRINALAQDSQSPGERARTLALMATGLQLVTDYGEAPPAVHLSTDRATLAEALEWQRRTRGYQERGFSLADLQTLPTTLFASSILLLCVVALTSRGSALAVAVWGGATLLLTLGALMLTDVALSGDPALRYLAVRQFQSFGVGNWWVPLTVDIPVNIAVGTLGSGVLTLWWPLLITAALLILLRAVQNGSSWPLAVVRAWVRGGSHGGWSALQSMVLIITGIAIVFLLGMPAAVSELLILLGCVGVASYLAAQAPHANAGAGLQFYNLGLVATALALAVGGSVARGDLGHALVALLLAACFVWFFGGVWLRGALLLVATVAVVALAMCLIAGHLVEPLPRLLELLPPHAQDRVLAMFDPFHASSSDLARVRWLMHSADLSGWGVGYAPWQGISSARVQDGLPLQGPSDYVPALATTLWGQAAGLALMGLVLAVFTLAAVLGLRTALKAAMPQAVRWLAAVGGFGCVVMAAKVVLSVGGVTGVLPLTGLPVGLLGYGPVTHLAALLYLSLALGTLHVRPVANVRGIHVHAPRLPSGAVRLRGLGLALSSVAGLGVLLALGFWHLRAAPGTAGQSHVAQARLDLAQALTQAMVVLTPDGSEGAPAKDAAAACAELGNAVAAWNQRLASLARPVRVAVKKPVAAGQPDETVMQLTSALHLDVQRLSALQPTPRHRDCRALARTLGQMLETDLPRLVGRQSSTPAAPATQEASNAKGSERLSVFDKPRALGARDIDYTTANAWWGRPGCLLPADELQPSLGKQTQKTHSDWACAQQDPQQLKGWTANTLHTEIVTDAWLQRNLAPPLFVAQRTPAGSATLNHHTVAVGPALGVALVPSLQQTAQRMVDCATGRLRAADCEAVLPRDAAWRERHYSADNALRAGAMGLVLAEVDTGRIVALAGAVSDCTLNHLGQSAQADKEGKMPALREGSRCAQLPDQRSAWLALQHPALWMVPPGSSLKPFSMVAGMDAGLIAAGTAQDDYWRGILAESHERLPIQRIALASGQRYLDVLSGLGYGQATPDILWGGPTQASDKPLLRASWTAAAYAGTSNLRTTSMTLVQAETIRREKLSGVNVDKRYGEDVTQEFVAARQLADASVGGGDIRISALGLVDAWRALDMRARGKDSAPTLHLLEQPGQSVPAKALGWASQTAASRALNMTTGVTASAWKGTAQGACRVVFGACPAQGLTGLSGKTGSSDFLTEEDGPYVKPGMQLPAKLFGGVFAAPDGKRYAVAVMALRVREGKLRTLDLTSSAPAEAALTMMRSMGLK
ncbi:MAG: FtsW/RodA/SpoVE family cell cycle protein [Rhodoferax sp.]|nr:FtsW/RodA/SpoVE family cell cycle protein [Rhodoferax sp.]